MQNQQDAHKQQENIFRLSAIVYANKNYELSPVTIHRDIIEDALYQINSSDGVSLYNLIKFIEDEYLVTFSEDEVKKVLHDPKNNQRFYLKPIQDEQFLYLLNINRRSVLDARKTKTLDDFIHQYIEENKIEESSSEKIYRYLYDVYTNNVDSFNRLLSVKNVKEIASFKSPNEEDAKIINDFLDWDNPEKNEAIFNLASYALEYCMLTSKKGSSLKIENLQKKRFYLDTNILYRALGINGLERQERTLSFFKKLNETKSELRLSKVTLAEFRNSLDSYIKKLRKSETPAISSKVYTEFVDFNDIYRCYHEWASKNHNPNIDVFAGLLEANFKDILVRYDIKEDTFSPFSEEEKEEQIKEMATSIRRYSFGKYFDSAYNDAHNILWVEATRTVGENNIFSTKTFLLSSDWGLHVWDGNEHSKENPVVIMPSQWLSILLRYGNRTQDDFRSFVCFLNIQTKSGVLSSEQISVILAGISSMTTNIEQQRFFLETIVEREFKEGAKGMTNEQIRKIAEKETERMLQEKVEMAESKIAEMEVNVSELKGKLESKDEAEQTLRMQNAEVLKKNQELTSEKSQIEITNRELVQSNHKLTNQLSENERIIHGLWERESNSRTERREIYKKQILRKWRTCASISCAFFVILLIGLIVIGIVSLYVQNPFFDFIKKLVEVKLVSISVPILFAIINLFTATHCYNCWNNPTYINDKISKISYPDDMKEISLDEFKQQNNTNS